MTKARCVLCKGTAPVGLLDERSVADLPGQVVGNGTSTSGISQNSAAQRTADCAQGPSPLTNDAVVIPCGPRVDRTVNRTEACARKGSNTASFCNCR